MYAAQGEISIRPFSEKRNNRTPEVFKINLFDNEDMATANVPDVYREDTQKIISEYKPGKVKETHVKMTIVTC